MRSLLLVIFASISIAGCERVGIPDPVERAAKDAAMRDEEGKAIGGACRQSGRALEDCYTLNQGAIKASVFNGWREMNDYMVANKIEPTKPELPSPGLAKLKAAEEKKDDAAHSTPEGQSAPADDGGNSREQRLSRAKAARLAKEARRKGVDDSQSGAASEPAADAKDTEKGVDAQDAKDTKEAKDPKPAQHKH